MSRFANPDGFVPTQCRLCHWLRVKDDSLICNAYPDGIPQQVVENKLDHRYPIDGDGGFRFTPTHEVPDDELAALFVVLNQIPQKPMDEPTVKARLSLRYGIRFPDDQ